jgi:hypothetical protein
MIVSLVGDNRRFKLTVEFPWKEGVILRIKLYNMEDVLTDSFTAFAKPYAHKKYFRYYDMFLGYLRELLGI